MKNKINKQALREKIQSLEGLSNEDKSQLLALLAEQKKYGLVWEDSPEEAEEVLRENIPVLREVAEKRLDDGGDDAPNHVLIEGDNLHALTALTYTHEGKVDVIYIDPPYNTGNKDFVYNDRYIDEDDSYKHSKWLAFMKKRLLLAKRLMSDSAVIFISIDDNEHANLKILCDEIFGENNFMANIVWQSTGGSNTGSNIVTVTEYILVYAKNKNNVKIKLLEKDASKYNLKDEHFEQRGKFYLQKLDGKFTKSHYSDSLNYPIDYNNKEIWPGGGNRKSSELWNWRWSKDKVEWGIANGFISFVEDKNGSVTVKFKNYEYVDNRGNKRLPSVPPKNIITTDVCSTSTGTQELNSIIGEDKFDFPKNTTLVKYLINLIDNNKAIVLDFFAGSGTSLHAVMKLNNEDNGNRQCIIATNNENGICENVTYCRNRKVIHGYVSAKGEDIPGLVNNNLRYYKTEFVSRDASHQSKKEIAYAMTDLLCIKEGIYDEQDAFGNLSLTGKSKMLRYFAEEGKQMLLIYDSVVIPYIVKEIEQMDKPEKDIKIYIFADGSYPYTADFDNVLDKVTLIAMPYAMDRALKLVLPERDDIELEVELETVEDNA